MGHGVPFEASYCPFKTSYPTDDYYLYTSGNESAAPYRDDAKPAPRGHRARGPGLSGKPLFAALRAAVERNPNIEVRCQARVSALHVDPEGRIVGVSVRTFRDGDRSRKLHAWASKLSSKYSNYSPRMRRSSAGWVKRMEARADQTLSFRALGGVVLASGGFIRNREMVAHHAPEMPKLLALGSLGDDGSGIRLGQGAGAAVGRMERISAWRFYNPPVAFVKGVLVDQQGQRICNEELYGATVGRRVVAAGSKAWLIIDAETRKEVRKRLTAETIMFQRLTAMYLLSLGQTKAASIGDLADAMGMAGLGETIEAYNAGADAGEDAMRKSPAMVRALRSPPYYAVDVSVGRNPFYPTPSLTLGGLAVDEPTGRVLGGDGQPIEGLFAAGRCALGVCSEGYVSGLAIADAVYSGRRAGCVAAGGSWRD
jgi:3-oxo-5alpha-steroid 4-dehydrogenase